MWYNTPRNINQFRAKCTEKLVEREWNRLAELSTIYPSLTSIRTVQSLAGRGAPIIAQPIQSNPEKLRWLIMTLLACPGRLVKYKRDSKICSLCGVPVNDIFPHIVAFCARVQNRKWRTTNILNLIASIQSDPGSATSSLVYWLFLSSDRFRIQQDYVDLFVHL